MKNVLTIAFVSLTYILNASHFFGGEISWECDATGPNAGKYKFHVSLYRDCGNQSVNYMPSPLVLSSNSPIGQITCNQVGSKVDISPQCFDFSQQIKCDSVPSAYGAVEMVKYESDWIALNGTPPSNGWVFSWVGCCRPIHVNVNGSPDIVLRAIMYPFSVNGINQNASTCYDNSPKFLEPPITVVAAGGAIANNLMGYDKDYDSLNYHWAQPLSSNGPIFFTAPYSFNSPFPSTTNVSISPTTGQLSFNPNVMGSFASCVQVDSYRQGQMIASTFRDYPLIVSAANSSLNTPPVLSVAPISPNQATGVPQFNLSDSSYLFFNVFAGDSVRFKITAVDTDLNDSILPQLISWQGTSSQFGISPITGCDNPPCAVASPLNQINFVNAATNTIRFDWRTDCNNFFLNGYSAPFIPYVFILKFIDDACTVPSSIALPLIVNVFPPIFSAPDTVYANVVSSTNTEIVWTPPTDTATDFNGYEVSFSTNISGPYTVLDTIFPYTQTQFSVNPTQLGTGFIVVRTLGPCELQSIPSIPVFIQSCAQALLTDLNPSDTAYTSQLAKILYIVTPNCINTFQWQLDDGSGWQYLQDNSIYSGTLTSALLISGIDTSFNENKYRCIVGGVGVSDTSTATTLYVINNIGIFETEIEFEGIISPNPNDGYFTLEVEESIVGSEYVLIDELGRLIEKGKIESTLQDFDLSGKPKGIYRLSIKSTIGIKTMAVVVQ